MTKIHWKCLIGAVAKGVGIIVGGAVGIIVIGGTIYFLGSHFQWMKYVFFAIGSIAGIVAIIGLIADFYKECLADEEKQ